MNAMSTSLERICRGFRRATEADREHAADRRVRARALGDGLRLTRSDGRFR